VFTENYRAAALTELPNVVSGILEVLHREKEIGQATVLVLTGDLGAGKTTFVQTLAKQLGVSDKVQSPTFTIMKNYQTQDSTFPVLVHMDAYRLESIRELVPLQFAEIQKNKDVLLCIEWGELIKEALPKNWWQLSITETNPAERVYTLQHKIN